MGVTGLWKQLDAASRETSFEKVALKVFDDAHRDLTRGGAIDTNRRLGLRVRSAQRAAFASSTADLCISERLA